MNLSRLDRVYLEVDVTAALPDGTPTDLTGADVALLPSPRSPDADTAWMPAEYAGGVATVLLAGPDADQTDALSVPAARTDLWVRVVDVSEVQAVNAGRVTIT